MKIQYILSALLCLCLLIAPAAAAGGAGTASNPYIIQTPAELQSIANDLSAYYVLGNDINMDGISFTPIGSAAAPFFGSLDGRDYTIRNLNIDLPSTQYVGLFAVITAGATIKNLNFEDCTITGNQYVGMLYGQCNGVSGITTEFSVSDVDIENCTVSASGNSVGGICGLNGKSATGTISYCDTDNCLIESTGSYSVGGICGYISTGSSTVVVVENCVVRNSHIRAATIHVGGICGYISVDSSNGYAYNCIVEGCLIESIGSNNVGGICGSMSFGSSTTVGLVENCVVRNCIMVGGNNVGGICGFLSNAGSNGYANDNVVENCTVRARNSYAGGIAGCKYAAGFGNLSGNSVSSTTILASSYAGGICSTFTR